MNEEFKIDVSSQLLAFKEKLNSLTALSYLHVLVMVSFHTSDTR